MDSPAILDFDALLAPVPGDDPAGVVDRALRDQLKELRIDQDDPELPAEDQKKADWRRILSLGQEALTKTGKDLQIAANLTEALLKQHGFAGLRDGLRLLREMVQNCWDRLAPPIEDGDLEVRAPPFNWLAEADRGALFPNTVRTQPLFVAGGLGCSWVDWRQSQEGKGEITNEDFNKTVEAMPLEAVENLAGVLTQCRDELHRLTELLNEKMGTHAPSMDPCREAVEDCHRLVQQILQQKRPEGGGESDTSQESTASEDGGASGRVKTRQEAYRRLAQIAATLQQLEPHSPIPYLIQKAVELGGLPFPQLIKALIRDANVLSELHRELGIKDAEGQGSPGAPAE